jgi:hypothetical protein
MYKILQPQTVKIVCYLPTLTVEIHFMLIWLIFSKNCKTQFQAPLANATLGENILPETNALAYWADVATPKSQSLMRLAPEEWLQPDCQNKPPVFIVIKHFFLRHWRRKIKLECLSLASFLQASEICE